MKTERKRVGKNILIAAVSKLPLERDAPTDQESDRTLGTLSWIHYRWAAVDQGHNNYQ